MSAIVDAIAIFSGKRDAGTLPDTRDALHLAALHRSRRKL